MTAPAPVFTHASAHTRYNWRITPREQLDFKFDETIPVYWFGNDPVLTRLIDVIMATFPEGERFFISSVRQFKDKITDAALMDDVHNFTRQEAQHGIIHTLFNDRLRKQGQPIDKLLAFQQRLMQHWLENYSPEFNLAYTAACEHVTALLAECFFSEQKTLKHAHPKVRAMLAWHAIEEMEHKTVAFDVMQQVAKVQYPTRAYAMVVLTGVFMLASTLDTYRFLRYDGYSTRQRLFMLSKTLPKIYGKKGMLAPMWKNYLAYFKPRFHPSQIPHVPHYSVWLEAYAQSNDAVAAGEAFFNAAKAP